MKGFTLAQFAGAILLTITALLFFIMPELKQPDPVTPAIIANAPNEVEEATLLNAADTLMMECPDLVKYGVDVKEIRMELGAASLTAQREKQWHTQVSAEVVIAKAAQYLPEGQHCHYGLGMSPIGEWGFYSSKGDCIKLCDMTESNGYGYKVIMHSLASEAVQ